VIDMSIRMSYEVQGIKGLEQSLNKTLRGLEDFTVPLDRSGIEMYKSINKNFEAQGRPSWAAHAPLTRILRGGGMILQDSGKLKQSVTSKTARGSKYKLSKTQLVIGSNLKARGSSKLLAEIQQLGQPAGVHKVFGKPSRRGMPGRPFLMIHDEDAEMIERIFSDYLEEITK
jgi:phage gpG-like protein